VEDGNESGEQVAWGRWPRGKIIAVKQHVRREGEQSIDVLIVGPDAADTSDLIVALDMRGIRTERAHSPESLARAVVGGRPAAIVVDMRNEDELAHKMLRWLCRNADCNTLIITALTQVDARLVALELGARDHLIAPFEMRECVGRVQHLIGRKAAMSRSGVEAGDLTINAAQRCVLRTGERIPLTPREIDVLMMLVENADRAVSKHDILNAVWKGEPRSENVVEANVSSLRRKLHALGPPVIHTVHRSGYVFRPVMPSTTTTRAGRVAERDRRERDGMVARRDELIRRPPAERAEGPSHQ
jgi:two-component system, OmpR family, response regulator